MSQGIRRLDADLSIKGENIQALYRTYSENRLIVNRRYQRKLVWNIEEKRAFVESILKGYPVPLILLVEREYLEKKCFEIIDGMQRLNAITSFIEQEYDFEGNYFDLNTMAETKLKKDQGELEQKEPVLDRGLCTWIAGYQVPLSIFQDNKAEEIDEVFRRLNSNGRHLSKQELRQAGSLSRFAKAVRILSTRIRGDASATDILLLGSMKNISITNKDLPYGLNVNKIFWVSQNIIPKDYVRNSRDEEIVADLLAWILLGKGMRSSTDVLDDLYGFTDPSELNVQVEKQLQKIGDDLVIDNFMIVHERLLEILQASGKNFSDLLFSSKKARVPRYFQTVFLSLYSIIIDDNKNIENMSGLIGDLSGAGNRIMSLSEGGGVWAAKEKQTSIEKLCGVISKHFVKRNSSDPGRNQMVTRFENILMQSTTEQNLYDFKQGFHRLDATKFVPDVLNKVVQTLTAMANHGPNSTGYVLVGVSDKLATANAVKARYKQDYIQYSNFFVHGVDGEANAYHGNIDKYFTKLVSMIAAQPISDFDKDQISRHMQVVSYFGKSIFVFRIEAGDEPSIYEDEYYVRRGANVEIVPVKERAILFKRFIKK
jgi:hypothetical protein